MPLPVSPVPGRTEKPIDNNNTASMKPSTMRKATAWALVACLATVAVCCEKDNGTVPQDNETVAGSRWICTVGSTLSTHTLHELEFTSSGCTYTVGRYAWQGATPSRQSIRAGFYSYADSQGVIIFHHSDTGACRDTATFTVDGDRLTLLLGGESLTFTHPAPPPPIAHTFWEGELSLDEAVHHVSVRFTDHNATINRNGSAWVGPYTYEDGSGTIALQIGIPADYELPTRYATYTVDDTALTLLHNGTTYTLHPQEWPMRKR